MITMFNMQLGEVAPGGVGSGLYGMLVLAVITVFVAGLMVGRTPEYLGKKITPREIKLAAMLLPDHAADRADRHRGRDGAARPAGRHAQHRAARAVRGAVRVHLRRQQQRLGVRGHHASTPTWYNTALGLAMLFGRFLPIDLRARRWPARWPSRARRRRRSARCPPTGRSSSAWSPASRSILVALTFLPDARARPPR